MQRIAYERIECIRENKQHRPKIVAATAKKELTKTTVWLNIDNNNNYYKKKGKTKKQANKSGNELQHRRKKTMKAETICMFIEKYKKKIVAFV